MRNIVLLILAVGLLFSSCIMPKKYSTLADKYSSSDAVISSKQKTIDSFTNSLALEKDARMKLIQDTLRLSKSYNSLVQRYHDNQMGGSADATKFIRQIDDNRKMMTEYKMRLDDLEKQIKLRELELNDFRMLVSSFLYSIPSEGVKLSVQNDKILLSIDEALLFEPKGYMLTVESAEIILYIANFLAKNPDISAMVVGHTDNSLSLDESWDVSVKRASEIVKEMFKNKSVIQKNVIAAGRGSSHPLKTDDSAISKLENRRTEIVLTKSSIK